MAIIQKGLLGVEDFYNGTDTTFTRANSTGGTSTLTKAVFGTGSGGGDTSNPVAADRIRYVKAGGSDASNGLSWAAAKATLGAGLTDLTSGGVLYLAGNQTFASDPFTSITQDIHVVVLWGTLTCNVNVTVPANVTLEFRRQALLHAATGVTITINGILMAGNHRIFNLAGTGVVNPRNPANGLLNVNWWGVRILDPNATPAAVGITASIDAATNTAALSAASTFQNGDGVVIYGAGAAHALTTPAAPTVQPSVAAAATGTGLVVNAPAGGATSYSYKIVARTKNGGLTAAGAAGTTAAGFTLGSRSVGITSLSRSNAVVTVVTASAHELSVGSMVYITGTSDSTNFGGWFIVDTVADTTHFTFSNGLDTRQGASASATGGTVFWFNCNRVSWSAVTGAWEYYIYGRTGGSEVLLGVSRPQGDTVTDLTWDDFGATMMGGIVLPPFVPSAPPGAATSDHLVSVIASGAGTTSLVLKDNAGTTVVAATIRYDIAPNVKIAATASALGTLYFPQTNISHRYVVNSYLNLSSLTTLPVSQAGGLYLNETVELPSNTQWLGTVLPQPNGAPTFGWQPGSAIQVNSANPGFYQSGRNANSYFGLSFSSVGANGCLLFVGDRLNNATWDTCNFTTGTSTDYMGIGLMPRGTVNDTSFSLLLRRVTTSAGPSGSGGSSATPVIYFNRCGQTEIHSLQMSKRGVFFRFVASAADVSIDGGRMQGGIMPFLSCHHSGGVTNSSVAIKNYQIDTMAQAFVANMSDAEISWSGAVSMEGNNDPSTDNGKSPGRVTGRPINGLIQKGVVISSAGQLNGQNKNNVLALVGSATDGTLATNSAIRYLLQLINAGLGVGNAYSMFVQSTVPEAPTGVVAAGGSVPVADHTYKIVPVWNNGAEGILSAASATITTTPGNQTVNLSWTAVPGNPLGYNIYRDGALLLGTIPNTTTNSHSDTAGFVFGGSERTLPAGGPALMNKSLIGAPQLRAWPDASTIGLQVNAATSPTVDIFRVVDSTGAVRAQINSGFNWLIGTLNRLGGTTSSFPAIKRNGTSIESRLADDSAYSDWIGRRYKARGTALVAGDIALGAGWGDTAAVSAVTGVDQAFDFTVTANGTGIAASPTITPTFKDGTFGSAPIMTIVQRGGTGAPARIDYTPSATAPVITWGDTPVAGSTYIFSVICMGL